MNKETKAKLDRVSDNLFQLSIELESIKSDLKYNMDKKAISDICRDLRWATENCTVVGLHQVGEALDDNMGTGLFD